MFFVLDENNNKIEALDKEGVFAALEKAIADGSLTGLVADSAFVTKLKCCVSGQTNRIAFVTEAKYNEMVEAGTVENGVYYYITDDTSIETIDEALKALDEAIVAAENRITAIEEKQASNSVGYATSAGSASYATSAGSATTATNATNATNATKVNNLEIKLDENGVLKIGDIIIPQKKYLLSTALTFAINSTIDEIDYTLLFELKGETLEGRVFEIVDKTTGQIMKYRATNKQVPAVFYFDNPAKALAIKSNYGYVEVCMVTEESTTRAFDIYEIIE